MFCAVLKHKPLNKHMSRGWQHELILIIESHVVLTESKSSLKKIQSADSQIKKSWNEHVNINNNRLSKKVVNSMLFDYIFINQVQFRMIDVNSWYNLSRRRWIAKYRYCRVDWKDFTRSMNLENDAATEPEPTGKICPFIARRILIRNLNVTGHASTLGKVYTFEARYMIEAKVRLKIKM